MTDNKIVVLGGGVTGLGVAWRLSEIYKDRVVLFEKLSEVGGLAATFSDKNISWDIGSHRIHPQYDPHVFQVLKEILGDDLMLRPRNGRIMIQHYALQYPPTFLNLLNVLGSRRLIRFGWDFMSAHVSSLFQNNKENNFESWTVRTVGKSLYDFFYKSYALKLWGLPPDQISFEPARNRVKKFEIAHLIKGLLNVFFFNNSSQFYYPANGIGQINTELKKRFLQNGGTVRTDVTVDKFLINAERKIEKVILSEKSGSSFSVDFPELVVSTLPLDVMHNKLKVSAPDPLPALDLQWRSLRLLYLQTFDGVEMENETIYLPGTEFKVGRISNIKKYSPKLNTSVEGTLLTLEFPCSEGDLIWTMPDSELYMTAKRELLRLGLLKNNESRPPVFFSKKIKNLYPLYTVGWEEKLETILSQMDSVPNLYMVGRGSLFLHCNIDHCLMMAFQLVDFLSTSREKDQWIKIRKTFNRFRVKD